MDVETSQLEKARIFAYFGFIGITLPLAGIITSCISISILNRLVINEEDSDAASEHGRIMSIANATLAISAIFLVAWIVFVVLGIIRTNDYISQASVR